MRTPKPLVAGLTRLELLIGLAGLALTGAAVLAFVGGEAAESQKQEAVSTAKRLAGAASDWKKEHETAGCPSISQLLLDKHLTRKDRSDDPWGGRFRISCSEERVSVKSAGGDGRFETDDDIAVDSGWNS